MRFPESSLEQGVYFGDPLPPCGGSGFVLRKGYCFSLDFWLQMDLDIAFFPGNRPDDDPDHDKPPAPIPEQADDPPLGACQENDNQIVDGVGGDSQTQTG